MPPAPVATRVKITRTASGHREGPLIFTLGTGVPATIALQAKVVDQNGAPFADAVTWSSGRPDIATVVAGVVTPVSAGACSIIATSVSNPAITDAVQADVQQKRPPARYAGDGIVGS
jgi:hypothetical protein